MLERLINGFVNGVGAFGAFAGFCVCGAVVLLIVAVIMAIHGQLTDHSGEGEDDE